MNFKFISRFAYLLSYIAVTFHCLFFLVESFAPQLLFRSRPDALNEAAKLFAFNQGFYNLFLALGLIYGIRQSLKYGRPVALLTFSLLCMLGASIILLISAPHLLRGVIAQGVPPALALILFKLSGQYSCD